VSDKKVKKPVSDTKEKSKLDYKNLFWMYGEATKLSLGLVFLPVAALLIGVFIDKKLGTTPLFIIVSIITGLFVFLYKTYTSGKKLIKEK
jgi:F0F1-type ATP synthase assembly protein I